MILVISLNSNACKFINKYYALLHKTSIKIHLSQKHSMHNRSYVQTFSSKHYPISKKNETCASQFKQIQRYILYCRRLQH